LKNYNELILKYKGDRNMTITNDTRTFAINSTIEAQVVRFKNRYGIKLVGHLYLPEGYSEKKSAAIVFSGPFGAVKEQVSGLYAQELAARGFVTLAFDPSFTGESGGESREVASPDINTEDFSAAIDFIGLLPYVDREKIGVMGICGLSGMAITAASVDTRIKAVSTASMYDMSRSIGLGFMDSYTEDQRRTLNEYISQRRWEDAENGEFARGPHEVGFDENGQVIRDFGFPDELPEEAPLVVKRFFDYYKKRAYHPRSVNSELGWTATTPYSFISFPQYTNIEFISPRPILLIAGENAHSRYYSEDVYKLAKEPKELIIIPEADHVDLYDNLEQIPFDKLEVFFNENLK
jgi:uncharacterized protein